MPPSDQSNTDSTTSVDACKRMSAYSDGRKRAMWALARHLGDVNGEGHLDQADKLLDVLLQSGAVMLCENHQRKMRELAKELTA